MEVLDLLKSHGPLTLNSIARTLNISRKKAHYILRSPNDHILRKERSPLSVRTRPVWSYSEKKIPRVEKGRRVSSVQEESEQVLTNDGSSSP